MEQPICVGETLDVSTVAAHREAWLKTLTDNRSGLRLQVDELTSIDTAGLQFLMAIQKEAEKQGKALVIAGANNLLQEKSRLLGLDSALSASSAMQEQYL